MAQSPHEDWRSVLVYQTFWYNQHVAGEQSFELVIFTCLQSLFIKCPRRLLPPSKMSTKSLGSSWDATGSRMENMSVELATYHNLVSSERTMNYDYYLFFHARNFISVASDTLSKFTPSTSESSVRSSGKSAFKSTVDSVMDLCFRVTGSTTNK